ncbi:MAG: AmmeMemoRadiSam system protein A, partial [Chromatiaceae bacterium]
MPSSETDSPLAPAQRATLITVARRSIEHGLQTAQPLVVVPSEYHRDLKAVRASFVTLQIDGRLRGCIGHLDAVQPVVVDVAENAFAAAFRDPRFSPLTRDEWPRVTLHLSLLTRPVPLEFTDEADLLRQLQPGEDGLILQDGPNRGTFL